MKLLFYKLIGFASITTLLFILLFETAFLFPDKTIRIFESKHKWLKVYERVLKSKKLIKANTIIIGDSVGGQIFPYYKRDNYLTSNGSVYAAGNYILVYNALKRNPNIRKVVLVSSPIIIGHKFERSRTCNNFIKPFFSLENLQHFSAGTFIKIAHKPFSFFYMFYFFKCLPLNEIDYNDDLLPKKTVCLI